MILPPIFLLLSVLLGTAVSSRLSSALATVNGNSKLHQLSRLLAIGDFEEFNQLFADATIELPDIDLSRSGLKLQIRNLLCHDIRIGDMQTDFTRVNDQTVSLGIDVNPFEFVCTADYSFSSAFTQRSGKMTAKTRGNQINTQVKFSSPTAFEQDPPATTTIDSCWSRIEIYDLSLEGLELFEDLVDDVIEDEVKDVMCEKLVEVEIKNLIDDLLVDAEELIDPYLKPIPPILTDPLVPEQRLANTDETLVNFRNTSKTVGNLLDQALQEADRLLEEPVKDDSVRGGKDLGINVLLRRQLLDDDGALAFDLPDLPDGADFDPVLFQGHDRLSESAVTLDSIRIYGLDSVRTLDSLNLIGDYTVQNKVQWEFLDVELDLTVDIKPSTRDDSLLFDPQNVLITEQIQVSMSLNNVDMVISALLAVDQTKLGSLELGSILRTENLFGCFLSSLSELDVAELDVTVVSVDDPVLNGFVSKGIDRVISNFSEAAFVMYEPTLLRAVPFFFQDAVRKLIKSGFIDSMMKDTSGAKDCPSGIWPSGNVDFRDLLLEPKDASSLGGSGTSPYGDLISKAYKLVMDRINPSEDDGMAVSTVNEIIVRPLTETSSGVSGRYSFEGDLFEQATRLNAGGLDADIYLRAYDAYIDNLDTFGAPLSILEAVRGQALHLNNTASTGVGSPVRLGFRFTIELTGDDTTIKNDLDVSLSLETVTVVLTALVKMIESSFLALPIEAVGNWRCWLAMLPAPELDRHGVRVEGSEASLSILNLGLSVDKLALNISCIECSGPEMPLLTELLSSPEAMDETTLVANDILNYVSRLLEGDFLQIALDRLVSDSRRQCPASPEYSKNAPSPVYEPFDSPILQEDSISLLVAVGITVVSLITALSIVMLGIRLLVRRRHRKWIASLPREKVLVLAAEQQEKDEMNAAINDSTHSLFRSTEISVFVRCAVPLVILGNIGFFLSGHLSLGASVSIVFTLAGESYVADNFYEFSMASSAIEVWNAGGKELAMLILLFSGIWPYTKQLISLFLWFASPRVVSVSKRGSIYLWLDALAKWSMLDIFILVLTLAAFRVSVQSPNVGFLPDGFYSLDLVVHLKWGLYANMIAQLISQISSHFIIHYHRRVVHQATSSLKKKLNLLHAESTVCSGLDEEDGDLVSEDSPVKIRKERLCEHAFARPHRGEKDKLVVRSFVNPTLVVFSVALSALIVAGCSVPSYSIDILGIVGILVESGQGFTAAATQYNLFTTVGLLLEQAAFTGRIRDYIGLGSLSILLITTVLLVPLAQCAVLMYMWFRPLARRKRFHFMITTEILAAWQYAEVYFLSVLIGSWQMGQVSEYILNAECGSLSGPFAQLAYYGILKEEDAQCFRVNTSVESGLFVLAAGALFLSLLNTFVLKAVRQYDRDKQETDSSGRSRNKVLQSDDNDDVNSGTRTKIHPVPVLFTDTFRWLLRRENPSLDDSFSDVPL